MDIPEWVNDYVGIEFVDHGRTALGVDCWGLVRLVYKDQFDIDLSSYSDGYETTKDGRQIQGLMDIEAAKWTAVDGGDIKVGDVAVFAIGGCNSHVGVVVSDEYMLHIERGIDSVVERFTSARWGDRLRAFYRHDWMIW